MLNMYHLIQSDPIICALYLHWNVQMSHLIRSDPIVCALYLHCNVEMSHLIQSDPIVCVLRRAGQHFPWVCQQPQWRQEMDPLWRPGWCRLDREHEHSTGWQQEGQYDTGMGVVH